MTIYSLLSYIDTNYNQIINNFQQQIQNMSNRASPIRGLQPNVREFSLESYALNTQNDRLTQLLIAKNNQIQSLIDTHCKLKNTYEAQANAYRKTIESLEKQLGQSQKLRSVQFDEIKQRYSKLTSDEVANLKNNHTSEVQFLFHEIAQLKASIQTYKSKMQVKDHELNTVRASYQREISMNTSQINSLNKKLIIQEEDKLKQIKDLTNRRQLQRSRTSGIVNSRKQTTLYIEKQLRKINQQVLQKTIAIQNINRQLNKEKKKHQQTTKNFNKKIESMTEEYQSQLKEKESHYLKIQKILKDQILEYKEKQIKLLNLNDSLQSSNNLLKKQVQSKESVIKSKTQDIFTLKNSMEKLREEHIAQINNLMKERKKRSSKSNLGSSRSLSSSMKQSSVSPQPSGPFGPQESQSLLNKFNFLPIVKQQASPDRKDLSQDLSHSNIVQQQNQNELQRAIYHYDGLILQLKRHHQIEVTSYKQNLQKSTVRLKQKQLQLQDVLTRFSPLVKIHAEQKSLQQDRKERIQRHWKADLAILQIMLNKYRIRTF